MNNKSAKVRQQAADLISRIAVVMKTCQEEKLMGHLGVSLHLDFFVFYILIVYVIGCIVRIPWGRIS